MTQECLCDLGILSMEANVNRSLSFDDIIKSFAKQQAKRSSNNFSGFKKTYFLIV